MNFNVLKITTKLRELPNLYVCYSLTTDAMHYVGVCKMGELAYTPDARENTLYDACFPSNHIVTMEVLFIDKSRSHCLIHASKIIDKQKPIMNKNGYVLNEYTAPIICNETGEIFQTIQDVVRVHNVNHAAVAQHLHKRPGHKTVKGRTYKRGSADNIQLSQVPTAPLPRRKIKNETTGEVFDNAAAVAKRYEVTAQAVSNHLTGYLTHIKGNIFTRL